MVIYLTYLGICLPYDPRAYLTFVWYNRAMLFMTKAVIS